MTHPAGTRRPFAPLGSWVSGNNAPTDEPGDVRAAVSDLGSPVVVVETPHGPAVAAGGSVQLGAPADGLPVLAYLPPLRPEQLGDPTFRADHALRFAYKTGAMANGIASTQIVIEMAKAGMLGSYGAAGQSLPTIAKAIDEIQAAVGGATYAVNLIHSPGEPAHEMATAELLLQRGVPLVEASAYLDLTPAIVRYRVAGFKGGVGGMAYPINHVIGKVSRVEVATKFLSPPPERILKELVAAGHVTATQAQLAARFPVADDVTVEADSGGHTDNQGERDYNITLSLQRAQAVKDYMMGKGIAEGRLSAVGFGPDKPIANNKSAGGRKKNRRTEFKLTQPDIAVEPPAPAPTP